MSSRPSSELISVSVLMIGSLAILYTCMSMREADTKMRIAEIHKQIDRDCAEEETSRVYAEAESQEQIADTQRWSERDVAEEETRRARVETESQERIAEKQRGCERDVAEEETTRARVEADSEERVAEIRRKSEREKEEEETRRAREKTKQSIVEAVFKHPDTFDSDGAMAVAERLFQLTGSSESEEGSKKKEVRIAT